MLPAALAFCVSMGVQCHSMDDLIRAYMRQSPAHVLPTDVRWVAEGFDFYSDLAARSSLAPLCPGGRLVYLGDDGPRPVLACYEEGAPIS